jgi:hypothetical protein
MSMPVLDTYPVRAFLLSCARDVGWSQVSTNVTSLTHTAGFELDRTFVEQYEGR